MGREGFTPPRGEAPATRVATLARAGCARVWEGHTTRSNSGKFCGEGEARRGGRRGGGGPGRRAGPHSPFSRVCRFARTRRKVCRRETRAEKCQGPRKPDVNNCPPPPVNKARPGAPSIPRIRASSRQGTSPGPAPPPHPHPPHPPLPGPRRRAPSCRSA